MATPKYNKLQAKVLQWANRDKEVFGVDASNPNGWKSYIGDFLSYAADEAYRLLRIPPMEYERIYTVDAEDIIGSPNLSVLGTNNFAGTGGLSYVKIPVPIDFVEMKSIRYSGYPAQAVGSSAVFQTGIVFNEHTDERSFFDLYAESYSNFYWMRSGDYFYIKPALPVGAQITFSYYRQLPALDADYSVVGSNYMFAANDANGIPQTSSVQPFLTTRTSVPPNIGAIGTYNPVSPSQLTFSTPILNSGLEEGDLLFITSPLDQSTGAPLMFTGQVKITSIISSAVVEVDTVFSLDNYPAGGAVIVSPALFFVTVTGGTLGGITYTMRRVSAYSSATDRDTALAAIRLAYPTLTFSTDTQSYDGLEVNNWLKDQNERILVWGALMNAGAFLDDEKIEARYSARFNSDIASLNNEERMRRAKGGNVQVHFNGRGLI